MVNDVVSCFGISEAPHGGVEASGIGRSHGRLGFEEMVRTKYIDLDRFFAMKKPWWYPYSEHFAAAMESFLDFQYARSVKRRLQSSLRAAGIVRRKDLL
jgi:succinate-semialdehyde dehydrogenase/glutarate-semialdehyde dehydrogenase